ncbi:MAG: spore cortex biosynthesis protein YabQ [Lachnospiraceae bacterium]|nr:spore cortex biosynthesis protein YabQ [uncultured Acetatifactor sp.]MCI8286273.1 spore cortex biosynthesis protein YabQ [Lachnospiraceae bacterium]
MANENQFLLHSFIMGVFITYVYDLLRIFRRVVPHGTFLISVEDLVFWIYSGTKVFLLMYYESDGTLRWFAVIGALTGMFLYRKLISPLLVKYVSALLNRLLEGCWKVLRLLFRPFGFVCGKAGRGLHRTGGRMHRLAGRLKRRIKNKLTISLKVLKINLKA